MKNFIKESNFTVVRNSIVLPASRKDLVYYQNIDETSAQRKV
jgi:hypothetical protein